MYIAHAPISFLANEVIQKKKLASLKQNERILIGITAILSGILPDIDILVAMFTTTPPFMHHAFITHAPIFYVCLWIILKLLFRLISPSFNKATQKILNSQFVDVLLNTFLIGTLFHLLADFFAEDVMLFYPFTTRYFSLFKDAFDHNLFGGYFSSIPFGMEILACTVFVVYIFNSILKKNKYLKIINVLLLSASILFLILTIYIHLNTYNKSISYDTNGKQNIDTDYDGLTDSKDMDIDNDGKDNIVDIDLKSLTGEVENIVGQEKWAVCENTVGFTQKFKYEAGGLTSFRLLEQAYQNIHSPIPPVLKDWATKNGMVQEYSWDYDSQEVFFRYLDSKKLLKQTSWNDVLSPSQGSIIFILDDKGNVLNVGIVLSNERIGIVLPYDQCTKLHTLLDVKNYYYDQNIKVMITE